MLERSRYNLQANNIDKSRIEYFLADVGHGLQKRELRGTVDTVMMNPPFYEVRRIELPSFYPFTRQAEGLLETPSFSRGEENWALRNNCNNQ